MDIRIGTSGYSYKEWKGRFYPDDLPEAQMLRFYAERFATVEINNTFYRMPSAPLLSRWAEQTGEGFMFVLKAPQRITHQKRLGDVAGDLTYFYETASVLGAKLGPVLFQLPPYLKKDLDRLRTFLDRLPPSPPAAFEFRHASWADADVHDALRAKNCALCLAETDEEPVTELRPTADWGYLRLRRSSYADPDFQAWAARIRAQPWSSAFVFLKHEDEARGPEYATALRALLT